MYVPSPIAARTRLEASFVASIVRVLGGAHVFFVFLSRQCGAWPSMVRIRA
jgi:hypothetical protein